MLVRNGLVLIVCFGFLKVQAQGDPVSWSFSSKKISDKTYEVHFTAVLKTGWHLYSQVQPDDAIAIPTGFKINANPLLLLEGEIKEVGKLYKFYDPKLEISANQYSDRVDFVQLVRLKGNAKTKLTGSVEYQTCDDNKCLPPKLIPFSIVIN